MLIIHVINERQNQRVEHEGGSIELGRGPARDIKRCIIDDIYVSRDQLRLEELPGGRIRVENLSQRKPVLVSDGSAIDNGATRELVPPFRLATGNTQLDISRPGQTVPMGPTPALAAAPLAVPPIATAPLPRPPMPSTSPMPTPRASPFSPAALAAREANVTTAMPPEEDDSPFEQESFLAVPQGPAGSKARRPLTELGDTPGPETLAQWLETVLNLQQATAGSPEFYRETAQALVELIGLDLGLVLLRRNENWTVAGCHAADDMTSVTYSRTLLSHVLKEKQTFYQDLEKLQSSAMSLGKIEAVVASPIFGLNGDVVGVLYGMRDKRALARGGVRPLEAQLVQLLAAAVSSNLTRTLATRTRVQFEQFFSPELVRELERDPNLLEGRSQEVTVLFSDLRGFTVLSQRLGAQQTCRLVRDMMEQLTEQIVTHGGVIVDYAGDGILAMWNAPAQTADHALRACYAALAMHGVLPGLNAQWQDVAQGALALGIGLNTGQAQVGNTGSSRKFKYGPHGHTVNLASRVQDATKKLGLPLLITGPTQTQLPASFATRRLGQVRLPGVQEPVVLYELQGETAPPEWLARREVYEKALTLYEAGQWAQACKLLMPLLEEGERTNHYDAPTLKLMRRSWECLESRPDPFDPIIEVTTK